MDIIYAAKISDREGGQISNKILQKTFKEAIYIHRKLLLNKKRIAYFFIDSLINSFKAANQFYFSLFECESISKINTYKSGASPVQALADAKELIDCGLYDAVFIFGYEPLLTNKQVYGKDEIIEAMRIFESHSIIQCYNQMAHCFCHELGISENTILGLFDKLFMNFHKTYRRISCAEVSQERGRQLDNQEGDLFKLTDCANPNIDFSGGIILANKNTANSLQVSNEDRIIVSGVKYAMIEGLPAKINEIVGKKKNIFPHLRDAFLQAQSQAKINVVEEFKKWNLHLEVYTCYPPVPIGFLLATGMIDSIDDLPDFLESFEITITGGMNFARAPWNNPALNSIIDIYQKLKEEKASYGLVHGNGGIGETQGIAILERY